MQAITSEELELFEAVTGGGYENFILVRTELDGEETAAIASLNWIDENQEYAIQPLYIQVTPAMFERMSDPGEDLNN